MNDLEKKGGLCMDEHVKFEINYKNITVKASDDSIFVGKVNITNYARLSDMLKHSPEKFLTVICENEDGSRLINVVNREHIIWARMEA